MAFSWLLLASALLSCGSASEHVGGQTPLQDAKPNASDGPFNGQLDAYIKGMMKQWHIPGLAIAAVEGDETYSKGFGFADIGSSVPVTPGTLFFTGSTTKSFTAAALALLIDQANASVPVTFRTPISSLLREDFVLSDEWATAHTTIEDALSHRTGYPGHDLSRSFLSGADLAHNLRNLPMATEPRTTFMYNNIMFGVLGHLVSVLSGESLVSFFRKRLWKLWGMNNTYLGIKDVERHGKLASLATEYFWNNDTAALAVSPHMVMQPAIQGAGAIVSSVDDYSRYLRAMMKEAAPVSKAGHAALRFPHSIIAPEMPPFTGPQWYGLGWFGSVIQDAQIFFHAGQVNQFVSYMFTIPSRQFAAVIMVNTATIAHEVIALRLIYDHFGVAEKDRYNLELERAQLIELLKAALDSCASIFYPTVAEPALPMPLSMTHYTGSYNSAGYGTAEVELECSSRTLPSNLPFQPTLDENGCRLVLNIGSLQAAESLTYQVIFQHISGDHWLGWAFIDQYVEEKYERPVWCVPAEFRIDVSGKVDRMGIKARLMEERGSSPVWFDRIE